MDWAFDIETTGLNPWEDRVVTIAFVNANGTMVFDSEGLVSGAALDSAESESALLGMVGQWLSQADPETLYTWNGDEFDFPFLAVRNLLNGMDGGIYLQPTGQQGKYGKPLYRCHWYQAKGFDIAPSWSTYAEKNDIRWSLKPVAQAHDIPVIEVDFTLPQSILGLTKEERTAYCLSDAEATWKLSHLGKPRSKALINELVLPREW